ncbi:serine-rich adhesin for platelets isoform X4 [Drosophila bipectinata]|uniref:serine-rich adhesin for platelets isoform X4 n=1 Tax=Drosophila bipectinata TaxID=42026 RepID=UPI0038B273C1
MISVMEASAEIFRIMDTDKTDILEMSVPGGNLSGSQSELQDIASAIENILPRTTLTQPKDEIKKKPSEDTPAFPPKSITIPTSCPTTSILNLPPPTAFISLKASSEICEMDSMPTRPFVITEAHEEIQTAIESTINSTPSSTLDPNICDFDSDTELSVVAAASLVTASVAADSRSSPSLQSTSSHLNSTSSLSTIAVHQIGCGPGVITVNSNGHNISNASNSTHLCLNTKQQRQQKRRRERAQRLQAERDGRSNSNSLISTHITGTAGVNNSVAGTLNVTHSQGNLPLPSCASSSLPIGNGPANGLIYHINSAGSMGEDSNNSNGNFTSSSNGSNILLPPTDSIASLLLNPPNSPECNSGLMATPSDSEGESLDEDLLSTSSSSTLLLPRDKPAPRPPPPVRRKLPRSPVLEEEIIDGFAILEFKTYEDLEFAIKLGQKRKEKRLSALEELTCTYSIEEMKVPKILDTGQPHPLRVTTISTLAVVANNSSKENIQAFTRNNSDVSADNISNKIINTNGPVSNNNSDTTTNVVYMLPSVSTDVETHAEPVAFWRSEYERQSNKTIANCTKNKINSNIENHTINKQLIQSDQSSKPSIDESGIIIENSKASFVEKDKDLPLVDVNRPIITIGSPAINRNHLNIPFNGPHIRGIDVNTTHNSNDIIPINDKLTNGQKSLSSIGIINSFMSSDPTEPLKYAKSGHQLICKQATSSSQSLNKSHILETNKRLKKDETCTLEVQELEKELTPVVGVNKVAKKENITDDSKKIGSVYGDDVAYSGVPISTILSGQNLKTESSTVQTQVKAVISNVSASMTSVIAPDSELQKQKKLNISPCDTRHHLGIRVTSPESGKGTTVGVSVENEKNSTQDENDHKIFLSTNVLSNGQISGGHHPIISCAQTPSISACPFTIRNETASSGLPPLSSASSVFIENSIKSNDNLTRNNNPKNSSNGSTAFSSVGITKNTDPHKNISVATATLSNPTANGILSGYSTSSATSVITSTLPRSSPNQTTKLVSSTCTPISVGNSTGTSTSNGISLLFSGTPSNTLNAGLPMLIHGPQYRAPYANYSLYSPYNSINHGPYLAPIVPVPPPNLLASQLRTLDNRSSHESSATTKVTIAPNITLPQCVSMASIRSVTPQNNNGSINICVPQPGLLTVTTAGSFHSTNSTVHSLNHSHIPNSINVPAFANGACGAAAPKSCTITSGLSSLSVTALPAVLAQTLPPPSTQIFSQTGNFSSMPQMLPTQPLQATSITSQHQTITRCENSVSASTSTASNIGLSLPPVQSLTTAGSSVSASSLSPSSVIQKVISPKSDIACNKDGDLSCSTNTRAQNNVSTSLSIVTQSVNVGSTFCGTASSQYGITSTLSSSLSIPPLTGCISISSPKAGLWLNSPAVTTTMSSCGLSAPVVSSACARPTPPLLNISATNIAKVAANAAMSNTHITAATSNQCFQSTAYIPAHSAQLASSSTSVISSTAVSSFSLVSRTLSTNVPMTNVSTNSAPSSIHPATVISNTSANTPHPFSAESLFQPSKNDQADLLRRELDSRFLDRSGLAVTPTPSTATAYIRPELQHHQHHHTPHHHQNQQLFSSASPAQVTSGQLLPPPLFKDISKLSAVDQQFYRNGIGMPNGYAGYSPTGILHSGVGGSTPFVTPNHLTSFSSRKTGRWNAMHVRIAWEIYYHQNKQSSEKTGYPVTLSSQTSNINVASVNASIASSGGNAPSSLNNVVATSVIGNGIAVASGPTTTLCNKSTPSIGLNATSPHLHRASELPPATFTSALQGRLSFEASPLASSFIGAPPSHIGTTVSPFGRYVNPFGFPGLTHFGGHIEAWRTNNLQRNVAYHPSISSASTNWSGKTDSGVESARREAEERERELREREQRERDRQRREREERERKEKEEKLKREQQERERERDRKERERERREIERREIELAVQAMVSVNASARDRSPLRNVGDMNPDIRIKEEHPRAKDEQEVMLMRASAAVAGDPRYHSSSLAVVQASAAAAAAHHHHANIIAASRHGLPPPPHLARAMLPPTLGVGGPITHFSASAPPGWGIDPYRDPYPIIRYNPIMEAALRHEAEERQKAINIYAAQSASHLRVKDPPPTVSALGPTQSQHRLQTCVVSSTGVPQSSQIQQLPLTQLSTGIVVGKNSGPAVSIGIPVQHMIAVDSLSHQTVSTKETDHSMGTVVSAATVGLSTVSGGVIGLSPVPSVAPSR